MIRYHTSLFFTAGLRFWLDYLRSSELREAYSYSILYGLEWEFIDFYNHHRQNGDSISQAAFRFTNAVTPDQNWDL